MRDEAAAVVEQLQARAEQTNRTQAISWMTGPLERSFALRINEIVEEADRFGRRTRRARRSTARGAARIPKSDEARLRASVSRFFADLGARVDALPIGEPSEEDREVALVMPHEQRLLLGQLLLGQEDLQEVTASLVRQVGSADEMAFVDEVMSERLLEQRSPAVLEGLLVAAFAAIEDVMLAAVRLALMTCGDDDSAEEASDNATYLRRLTEHSKDRVQGGPSKWRATWKGLAGFDMTSLVADWDLLVEAHRRRNAHVHQGGRVDRAYMRNAPVRDRLLENGEHLTIDASYVVAASYGLRAVGSALLLLLPSLLGEGEHPLPLSRPNGLVCDLLWARRYCDAERVAKVLRAHESDLRSAGALFVNELLASRESGAPLESIRSRLEEWSDPCDGVEWAVARAALLRDEAAQIDALRAARASGADVLSYSEWPLFRDATGRVRQALTDGGDGRRGQKRSRGR